MKNKLLWISLLAPYDNVSHAGGKVHNYQLKSLNKLEQFDIYLVSFCYKEEKEKIDLQQYNINHKIFIHTHDISTNFKWHNRMEMLVGKGSCLCQLDYIRRQELLKQLKEYKKSEYNPSVIILQWTEVVMLIKEIKKIFPQSKLIAIEEDVSYLTRKRIVHSHKGIRKVYRYFNYKIIQKKELKALKNADLIVLNNPKDRDLILGDGIHNKTMVVTPYFNNMKDIERKDIRQDVLFYGAMGRYVNDISARWFLNNVFNKLVREFPNIRFVIVGANPTKQLLEYQGDNVIITGFVDSPEEYFKHCMCLVAPLQLGAGIKIKILEGMSSGIPVLTNDIGIEGIPAKKNVEYYHCEEPQQYIDCIKKLINNPEQAENVGKNGKRFINKNYNLEASVLKLGKIITEMMEV